MQILIAWFLLALSFWLTAVILPGIRVKGFLGAIIAAAVFGVLNWLIGWFLFVVIGIATLGLGFLLAFLTRWLVNAIVLKITAAVTDSLKVDSLGWALGGALCIAAIGTLAEAFILPLASV